MNKIIDELKAVLEVYNVEIAAKKAQLSGYKAIHEEMSAMEDKKLSLETAINRLEEFRVPITDLVQLAGTEDAWGAIG